MAYELQTFASEDLIPGLSLYSSDFQSTVSLNENSYNVTHGLRKGIGPRYGFSPIPGQSQVSAASAATGIGGLTFSESASSSNYFARTSFFGALNLRLKRYSDFAQTRNFFVWLVASSPIGTLYAEPVIGSIKTGSVYSHSADIAAGFPLSAGVDFADNAGVLYQNLQYPFGHPGGYLGTLLQIPAGTTHLPYATISTTGGGLPCKWVIGKLITAPTATHTGLPNFVGATHTPYGVPSGFNSGDVKKSKRDLVLYNMVGTSNAYVYKYSAFPVSTTYYLPALNANATSANLADLGAASVEGRLDAVAPALNTVDGVLLYDPELTTDSSYSAVLFAAGKTPVAAIVQEWERSTDGRLFQWVDLTAMALRPADIVTASNGRYTSGSGLYIENNRQDLCAANDIPKKTCWNAWPIFRRGLALDNDIDTPPTTYQVTLGIAGSGLLRKNTVYDLAFSVFNRRYGIETNVGTPAKVQTGGDDYVDISIFRDTMNAVSVVFADVGSGNDVTLAAHGYLDGAVIYFKTIVTTTGIYVNNPYVVIKTSASTFKLATIAAPTTPLTITNNGTGTMYRFWSENAQPSSSGTNTLPMTLQSLFYETNFITFRIYYREEGTYEWLPAGEIDAAEYLYNPRKGRFAVCSGAVAGLPGGQPGAFNDYSNLQQDTYIQVISWRDRAWWFSRKNVSFSLRNNIFAYPLRNSFSSPTGEFRGAIVHAYPGQSEQNSRLIVFGSKETYIGRFTGQPTLYPVTVGPGIIGQYPLDGSDFLVDTWTSNTAFSWRTAVVAEGLLYFWGENGIFLDQGNSIPTKISWDIEPYISTIYDTSKTSEFHSYYNQDTHEILWFFQAVGETVSRALCFNVFTQKFYFLKFTCKVDSISPVSITDTEVSHPTDGKRAIASVRTSSAASLQRAYYFDQRNRSGDMKPEADLLVTQVAASSDPSYRVFILDYRLNATLATITVGDTVCIQQGPAYSEDATVQDCIGVIIAKGTIVPGGTSSIFYVTVKLPDTVWPTFPTSLTLTSEKFFPIYLKLNNGIAWRMATNYWTPQGLNYWGYWQFVHMLFKVTVLPQLVSQTMAMTYRTPISRAAQSNTITFSDNSDGNFQVYSQLKSAAQSFEGQGVKFDFSGVQIGGEWVLQYLGVAAHAIEGDNLQTFEG